MKAESSAQRFMEETQLSLRRQGHLWGEASLSPFTGRLEFGSPTTLDRWKGVPM